MSKRNYVYFWYHGGMDWNIVDKIETAINNKNFKVFMKYKKKYKENNLPNTITVFNENDDIIDNLDVTNEANFDLITYSEHENG